MSGKSTFCFQEDRGVELLKQSSSSMVVVITTTGTGKVLNEMRMAIQYQGKKKIPNNN